jgi:NADH:ubiquinone oxidoreductase subunit F (NADH-binding)
MTNSASTAPPRNEVHRLLGHPTDLRGHVETHGSLEVALGRSSSWQDALVANLEASGLGGRGGGAFPTAIKVALARSHGRGGTIVVNGMEGEPASDKDKLLLTQATHLVLDGAQYLGALCRADRIVVSIPIGRDAVAHSVSDAAAERARHHYAGVPEEVVRPPDRFIAGEESALANWIESGNSRPVFRPDKGVPLRIGRRPALVHNVETLAHIALIARHGPAPFRSRGMTEEPGTCLVTISGAVSRPGVVEVDRGTPLRDVAALSQPVGPVQALLVGGYGGTWVGPQHFGTPYASIPLRTIGAAAGVGVIVALGEASCGLAESARIACYLADQGAGQCGPCVYRLPAIADDLARLVRGQADDDSLVRLHRRLNEVNGRGACRHPDGAVSMARSALAVFASDIAAHARGEPCADWRKASVLRIPPQIGLRDG